MSGGKDFHAWADDVSLLASRTIQNGRKILSRLDSAFSPAPKASANKEHPGRIHRDSSKNRQPLFIEDAVITDKDGGFPASRGALTFLLSCFALIATGLAVAKLTFWISPPEPPPPPPPSLAVPPKAAAVLAGLLACFVVSRCWPRDKAAGRQDHLVTLRGGKTFARHPSPALPARR